MIKEITNIDCPKEWELVDDYSSHRPALWLALINTPERPVTEFGCGEGSTRLIRKYCKDNNLIFFSYETNKEYAHKYGATLIVNYDQIHLSTGDFRQGIIFIDSAPGEQRKELIEKHANHSDIVIVHDTEPYAQRVYEIEDILTKFAYQLYYKPEKFPATSILSNTIDVITWANPKLTSFSTVEELKSTNL